MYAGMVHALHEIHRVLKPNGTLIDLRPAIGNRAVEVDLSYAILHAGEVDSTRTIADKEMADNMIAQVTSDGFFTLDHEERFDTVTDLDTLADLIEYAKSFKNSVLPDGVVQQVESLTRDEEPDTYSIHIRRPMHIARYRKQIPGKP